jgi:hypothetical protein
MSPEEQFMEFIDDMIATSKKERKAVAEHLRDIGQIGFYKELEYAPFDQTLH